MHCDKRNARPAQVCGVLYPTAHVRKDVFGGLISNKTQIAIGCILKPPAFFTPFSLFFTEASILAVMLPGGDAGHRDLYDIIKYIISLPRRRKCAKCFCVVIIGPHGAAVNQPASNRLTNI